MNLNQSFMAALVDSPPSKELCEVFQRALVEFLLSYESDQESMKHTTTVLDATSDSRDYSGRDHSVVAALLALLADLEPDQIWEDSPEQLSRRLEPETREPRVRS